MLPPFVHGHPIGGPRKVQLGLLLSGEDVNRKTGFPVDLCHSLLGVGHIAQGGCGKGKALPDAQVFQRIPKALQDSDGLFDSPFVQRPVFHITGQPRGFLPAEQLFQPVPPRPIRCTAVRHKADGIGTYVDDAVIHMDTTLPYQHFRSSRKNPSPVYHISSRK